ncbi:MAG TPA: EVE domain-containing protein, partial [Terriglobales bacterium]
MANVRRSDGVPQIPELFFLRDAIMNYWLMKSEPGVFGIDDLAQSPGKTAAWWGVRNYQARNFMRDQMMVGDQVF